MKTFIHTMQCLFALTLLAAAGLLGACNDPSASLPEKPELALDSPTETLVFPSAGETQRVTFQTNRPWTALLNGNAVAGEEEPWCSVSPASGQAGTHTISITVRPLQGDFRQALLLLNASAAGCEIAILQSGQPVVHTDEATAIDEAHATLNGSWFYSGDITVSEFGFGVAVEGSGSYTHYPVAEQAENGSFSLALEDLQPETTYVYYAYATAEGVDYLGNEVRFTTDVAPVKSPIAALKEQGLALATGAQETLAESLYIEGVVTSSFVAAAEEEISYITLQDDTKAHSGIKVCFAEPSDNRYTAGDRLTIRTKEGVLSHPAAGVVTFTPQTDGIVLIESGQSVVPTTVAHTELEQYEAMRVQIEHTQLSKLFTDAATYPTWSSAELWSMEVEESEDAYQLFVPAGSPLANEAPLTGSGHVTGLVVSGENGFVLCCEQIEDVAGLTGERFASLLDLSFSAPEFQGSLVVGEAASGYVAIPYRNGDNSVIEGVISVEVSGAAAEGIEVESATDVQIGVGNGFIRLAVSGTPTTAGEVVFTVKGLDALGADNSCTAEVLEPSLPEVGNFEAVFETTSLGGDYASVMPVASNSNASVAVESCVLTASDSNINGTKWKSEIAAIGWDENTSVFNPVQYFETSLTVQSGTLALSGLDFVQRINGGDVVVSIQYAINGGAYAESESFTLTSDDNGFTANLGKVAALTKLAAGTTVKIRIVATADKNATKWGVKAKGRLAIYGNVE